MMGWVDTSLNPDDECRLARGATVGRYVVLGRVGAGAMGEVYAAYDPELDRKLAIKLLRASRDPIEKTADRKVRLLREARAIAKLSHPNVVVVHDFGSLDDRVFIAMEFVDGSTVTAWLHAARRSWREVLKLFVAAGRGLQCAHEANLLHRDFKPENVMVTRDGQVRVMDFGLVQTINMPVEERLPSAPLVLPDLSPDATVDLGKAPLSDGAAVRLLVSKLTQTGALLGTPAYMAPEQFRGLPLDARSDQFSFCVALYESLYGQHPFGGANVLDLAANVVHGDPRAPPDDSAVPAWVRRVLRKGLARSPDDRYPSMKALLAELEHRPRSRRRQLVLAGSLTLLALGGVAVAARSSTLRQRAVCQVPIHRFDGVWEAPGGAAPRRMAIRTVFQASGKDYAPAAFGAVATLLDRYQAAWTATFRDACVATRVLGTESTEVLELRTRCLDDRLDELRALSDVLATPSGEMVENAVQAAMSLEPIERCTNTKLLRATQAAVRASGPNAASIQVVRNDLATAKALQDAGKSSRATAALFEILANARATGSRPLIAEALYQLGMVSASEGESGAAEPFLIEAVTEAQAGRHDEVLIEAMAALISVRGEGAHDIAGAELWHRLANASVERVGGNDRLRARTQANWAAALVAEGRFEEALKAYDEAVTAHRRALGPTHLDVGLTLAAMANARAKLGQFPAALALSEQAVAIAEAALGQSHPRLGRLLVNRSEILAGLGRYREARRDAERSYDLWTRNLGSGDQSILALPLAALGMADLGMGEPGRAVGHLREAVALAKPSAGWSSLATMRFGLARALWATARGRGEALDLAATIRAEASRLERPTEGERGLLDEISRWVAEREPHPAPRAATVQMHGAGVSL